MRNIQTMAPMCSEPNQLVALLIEEVRQAGLSPASAVICAGCAYTLQHNLNLAPSCEVAQGTDKC